MPMLAIQNPTHYDNQATTTEQLQVTNINKEGEKEMGCKQLPRFWVSPSASSHHSQLPNPSDPVPTGQVEPQPAQPKTLAKPVLGHQQKQFPFSQHMMFCNPRISLGPAYRRQHGSESASWNSQHQLQQIITAPSYLVETTS